MDQTVKFSQNLTENSVNIRQFSWFKKVRKVRRTLKPNLEPPNLPFGPKNRTLNLPNLKKPNEPPNRTRFVPSLGAFILQMDDNGKPAIFSWFAKKFSTDLSYLRSMSLHAMLLHYFSGLNIMKNGYEVTFWD